MTVNYKVLDFPDIPVRAQLFYPGGMAYEGGYTSGGVRVSSPEPGGRAYLEIELSLQIRETDNPWSSWIMSKTNGEIFRVRLTATPQLVPAAALAINPDGLPWNNNQPWDNDQNWLYSAFSRLSAEGLEGSTQILINMQTYGKILKHGHVIGIGSSSYMVDEISYDENNLAKVTVNPPLRKNVAIWDTIRYRPYFTGSITNGAEFRTMYEANNNGHIKMSRIIMQEVIL